MLNVQVQVSLPFPYDNAFVALHAQPQVLAFTLHGGTHVAESPFIDLGVVRRFESRRLLARLGFEYTYEPERRVVTVCGTDFASARAMRLTTVPEGSMEACRQYGSAVGFADDDLAAHPNWNYTTPLTPGLRDLFAHLVRTANDGLIEALHKVPDLIVQVRKRPPPLAAETLRHLLAVYRDGAFFGLHDPAHDLGPLDRVVTIESVFGGEVTLNYGEAFANVIGSTHDPKIAGLSWIQVWSQQFGTYPVICTSYQAGGFGCGSSLVGGHVIGGTKAKVVAKGSNSVWILPICVQHNNDDHVYMQALKYLKGIWLNNYLGP